MSIEMAGSVAYMSESEGAVFFSKPNTDVFQSGRGTAAPIRKIQNLIDVAFWGEDNRFPQHIEQQMSYCGIGKAALNFKASQLWGSGIIPGRIVGYENEGKKEIFEPLDRNKYKPVYSFIENRRMFRFWIEYLQDWSWYSNCFPEAVLSKDAKTITNLVHQESCDSRYKQMDEDGNMNVSFISKFWGAASDQFAKFDPEKKMRGLLENPANVDLIDNKFIKTMDCIDMYDPVESLEAIAQKQFDERGLAAFKSAILPVNYPSVNKTYYQVPAWDGARLAGWIEIACKIPSLLKTLYNKAFRIRYHIEVPETYFERVYGTEQWHGKTEAEQKAARVLLLKEMNEFLSGNKNAYKTFISFFDTDPISKKEYGQVKINFIEDKSTVDKELITSSAADIQILTAMQVHPTLFGAGTIGTGKQQSGGSDQREAKLISDSLLNLERNVVLEPLYLVRDYNREIGGMDEWAEDIVFRVRDTILTTLDQGKGTEKVVS